MSDSKLSTAPPTSITSRKDPWSSFTGIKSAASSASNVTAPNPTRNTRHIEMRRPAVPKLVRSTAKRRRARTNAEEEDLEATQARDIEQFQSEDDAELLDDIGDDDSIDSPSLLADS
jgi:hypothetical protein